MGVSESKKLGDEMKPRQIRKILDVPFPWYRGKQRDLVLNEVRKLIAALPAEMAAIALEDLNKAIAIGWPKGHSHVASIVALCEQEGL